ncbi:MAG TPA: ketopantoate reductase family protein [Anaerolineaceae bacterium]|nr:ketopantoate reductase family protein [Anaerolineaceae bacterium]HPN50191.1 ketopantoate reductase family protein [Anaerolineaceae bacterium]
MTQMKFLIFGAGAIGTYIGGSLALAGYPVVFVERPELAQTLRQKGLRLVLHGEEKRLPAPIIAGSLAEALDQGPFDAAVLAVKSFDTASVLKDIEPLKDRMPAVLSLQNGVENELELAGVLGQERVIAGTVTSAVGRNGPGDISLERFRGMGVAGAHRLVPELVAALQTAGLNPRAYPVEADLKWSKMLTNLLSNATSAILNLTPAEVFADPRLCELEVRQLRETLAVMKALGVGVVDLPKTPVRLLALGVQLLPLVLARPLLGRAVGGGRGRKMPSFHIDLHGRRGKSEVDYLNGAVVRFGQKTGVATPVNQLLNETLLALTSGKLKVEVFDHRPEALLKGLKG